MQLPNKIIKILAKVNSPYTIQYNGEKIRSVVIEDENIVISPSSEGCTIEIKGSKINLNEIESLETLFNKFNIPLNTSKNKKSIKVKDDIVKLFNKTKNIHTIKYLNGELVGVSISDPKIMISKTSVGFKIKMGNKEIAAGDTNAIKVFLEKMKVIPKKVEKKTTHIKEENSDIVQLSLNI